MNDLRLALRAFRWRRGGSLVVLVVAALTVAAAAIGPLYAAAAAESVLQDTLTQATADQTTIAFRKVADVSYTGSIDVVTEAQAERGTIPGYGPLVAETVVPTPIKGDVGLDALTQAVWRDGACDHLVVATGTCTLGAGDVVVSERSAASLGWKVGTVVTLDKLRRYDTSVPGSAIATTPVRLRVVGLFRPRSTLDPFWAGRLYFPFHAAEGPVEGPGTIDAVFVSRDVFPTLSQPTNGTIGADLVLTDPAAIRVADVPRVRADVEAYLGSDSTGPQPETGMLDLLDRFESQRAQTALAAAVVSAQLALLALLLLYLVITDTSEARGGEVALAKLRGLRPAAVAAVALREPVTLLLLGVPVGLLLAYVGALALARALFVPGVPVVVTPATWLAVGVAFLGGLLAAALASRRMFTRPVLDQWSLAGEAPRHRRLGVAVDVVLVVVAALGFVVLHRTSGSSDDGSSSVRALGWVAPGLLVIAVGLLLVRLAQPVLARLVPLTRASSRIGLFLALRQVVRRPGGLRLAGLLAVTLGLATFAVDAQSAAAQGRQVRAAAEVGAPVTLAVQSGAGPELITAVHTADPDGRWAMVVADWIPAGGSVAGRVLGVESARFAAVASWSSDYGAGGVEQTVQAISPPLPDPLPLRADHLRVRLTSGAVTGPAPAVLLAYRDASGRPTTATSAPLTQGTHDYDAAIPCTQGGCVFYGVALDRAQAAGTLHVDLLLAGVQQQTGGTWTPVPAPLDRLDQWRVGAYTGKPGGELSASASGVHLLAEPPAHTSPFVQYADVPVPLPMVTTPNSAGPLPADGPALTDGNGRVVPVASVATAQVLPLVGDSGVMVDLTALRRSAQQLDDDARWSVWLGSDAPPDAQQRLEAAGVQVDAVSTTAERYDELGREGPALALRLLLVCALAGAVLAASAVAISVAVSGRRRSYELAALRAVSVRRAALVRACVLEQGLLLGIGLLVGVPTGLVAARLALPTLPQTSSSTSLPLTLDVQTAAVAAFVVVTAVLLLTTAVVAGLLLVRQAVPERLREVAP